jgi:hypothetical protein
VVISWRTQQDAQGFAVFIGADVDGQDAQDGGEDVADPARPPLTLALRPPWRRGTRGGRCWRWRTPGPIDALSVAINLRSPGLDNCREPDYAALIPRWAVPHQRLTCAHTLVNAKSAPAR